MIQPIEFVCCGRYPVAPERIALQILDVEEWKSFRGYGPLPGIRSAVFEARPESIVGSRIRVVNTDGSTHVEQIEEWNPGERIRMRMGEFTPPLSRLAVAIEELWEFQRTGEGCTVIRTLWMFPKTWWARGALWLISILLKGAIQRHLQDIRRQVGRKVDDAVAD